MEAVGHVRQLYADPSDPVFVFLHADFLAHATQFYLESGGLTIDRNNASDCYQAILDRFRSVELGCLLREEVLRQGQLFQDILTLLGDGHARGRVWDYHTQPLAPITTVDYVQVAQSVWEDGQIEEGDMSEGEGTIDDPLPVHDW
jgi:hypothetical protein